MLFPNGTRYYPLTGNLYIHGVLQEVLDSHGYKIAMVADGYMLQHRYIWLLMTGALPEEEIDHRNRNRSDNRWKNLRLANKSQNAQNRVVHKNNQLRIRGIRLRKDGFFEPRLMIEGKAIYLGIYKELEKAVGARCKAEKEYFTHAG